jgi:hypothetical protein
MLPRVRSPGTIRSRVLTLLAERFESADHDGPHAYAAFLGDGDTDDVARLRQEAVAVVRQFLAPLNAMD